MLPKRFRHLTDAQKESISNIPDKTLGSYDRQGVPIDYIRVYMYVDLKNLELPLFVADTQDELAKMVGTSASVVRSEISRTMRGERITPFRYVDIPIEDTEDDW